MVGTTTRAVMDEYLHALLTGSDFGRFFAPDVVWTTMETGEEVRGRDAVRDLVLDIHTRAFRAEPELVTMLTGHGTAMLEAVFVGTHVGDLAGVAPTGLHVRLPYCMAYELSDGDHRAAVVLSDGRAHRPARRGEQVRSRTGVDAAAMRCR
jgi:predicted ester cyclase